MAPQIPTIQKTLDFIKAAHAGKCGPDRNPLWMYHFAVMNRLPRQADTEVKLAALLYGVLKKTDHSRASLEKKGYSKRTLDIVELLSSTTNVDVLIKTKNIDALEIKFADLKEKTDPRRYTGKTQARTRKHISLYKGPLAKLEKALEAAPKPRAPSPSPSPLSRFEMTPRVILSQARTFPEARL